MHDVVVFMWNCMRFVCIPIYYVMVRCNDIHLAKRLQYTALSLVGPSSSSRIGSHIECDTRDTTQNKLAQVKVRDNQEWSRWR